MNFKREMQNYFNLLTWNERYDKINDIFSQLEPMQKLNNPLISLNMAEVIIESCLLINNNDERLQQYDRALELVQNVRPILNEKKQIRQLLRSYHLECFIKYRTMPHKDVEACIQDIFDLSGKIIKKVTRAQSTGQYTEYTEYHSLGCFWRAYGLITHYIHKYKELSLSQKRDLLEKVRELAHNAVKLSYDTENRDACILSTYIFAFVEYLPQQTLHGDKTSTEEDFIEYNRPYEALFEVAHAYGSFEFEYLALLNIVRLNLERVLYAAGSNERKRTLLNGILNGLKRLEKYENMIRIPYLQFYNYVLRTDVYFGFIYFEVAWGNEFNYYLKEALKSAEKMKNIYVSGGLKSARERVEMHHTLNEVYMMKASFTSSLTEKLEYLKKCEELLLEDEKISAAWSVKAYSTWRDLSSIYIDLSKLEKNQMYFKKCVYYAKKTYESALETDDFMDAIFATYKIAIIAEDYQEYIMSIKHYELTLQLTDKIIQTGKDYPYYRNLKTYLQARLFGVKAKEEHRKGNYVQTMNLYHRASSILQPHDLYSYESLLYNIYSLFEEASIRFIVEEYTETFNILSNITHLFDETAKHYVEDYEPEFQSFMDRRAYDLQQLFFVLSKTFCIAQSHILQALIYRNTGDSAKAVELLKKTNAQLTPFIDRNVHIAGYHSFASGLYGLERSELAVRSGDYKSATSYLASASDQFENASQMLASDERLRQLCEGLMFFCQGWMYALEIMRRDIDLNLAELKTNFNQAYQFFVNASNSLKMFKKTSKSVSGFEKLLSYVYYSLLFQKSDVSIEKSKLKDMMTVELNNALQFFEEAEDMERYRFTRGLLRTLPQLEDLPENIFKPIAIPFTPYAPVFDTPTKAEPSGVNLVIDLDKTKIEVNEEIRYTIRITSDTSVYIKQIEGVFPKKGVKVVSGTQLVKQSTIEINRFSSAGQSIVIEFKIRASTPFFNRSHPRLIYLNTKNEKCCTFTSPLILQVYPKNTMKSGVVSEIDEKVGLVVDIMEELGIVLGEFPIVYHDINSYREVLAEYYFRDETKEGGSTNRPKKTDVSKIPIQQMAFIDPLGEVNILYDLEAYLYPQSIANLLSIIIHEKFGHGHFQQHTTLGKKLLELEYYHKGIKLLMKELEKISNKYDMGIQWLCVSTLVVDEGFATWLELKTFEKLLEKISKKDPQFIQQIHNEIDSFNKMLFESKELNMKHEYFALKYEKPIVNPYALGYNLFSQIEEKYGEKCVSKALELVADVPLTRQQIYRMQETINDDNNCADKRLEKITNSNLEIERNNVNMFENAVKRIFL